MTDRDAEMAALRLAVERIHDKVVEGYSHAGEYQRHNHPAFRDLMVRIYFAQSVMRDLIEIDGHDALQEASAEWREGHDLDRITANFKEMQRLYLRVEWVFEWTRRAWDSAANIPGAVFPEHTPIPHNGTNGG